MQRPTNERRYLSEVRVRKLARRTLLLSTALLLAFASLTHAQTTDYKLQAADSGDPSNCCRALTTGTTSPTGTALQSSDLKNLTGGGALWGFKTPAGTGLGGTIPSGTTPSFTLYMKKTANFGVIRPTATLSLNNGGTAICNKTGPDLTSTLQAITFSCDALSAGIPESATDKMTLWIGYAIITSTSHSVKVEIDIEGSTISRATVPNPVSAQITSLSPTSGPGNTSVTVTGANFGATQGTNIVKFSTTSATVSSWANTSITTAVPTGLNNGPDPLTVPVVVNVGGVNSNSVNFSVIAPPSLSSVAPTSGHRGDTVTIAGANFLATQGSSTVKFGTTPALAADTTWSNTSIVTKVPPTATDGPVVVRVSSQDSNSKPFTVIIPGPISGTITKASDSSALQGATVQAVLTGVIKGTATTAANGTYSIPNLDPGTYDVRVLATGYSSEVRSTTLANNSSATADVAMSHPGSISGQVTAGGATPLPGAAVTMFLNGIQKGSGNTDASGNYSLTGLHPGSYTLQVVNVGYRTKEQTAVVNDNATTTANVSLDVAPAGPVTYAYDALGRLISVTDPSGDAATYNYDPVGNILSIGRIGAGSVAITQITPASAPVNAPITIYGTGFSATPTQNTVTFPSAGGGQTQATVTSSTIGRIVTSVPADATTGTLVVGTPLGSTNTSFTVTTAAAAPTISGFTPGTAFPGTALTVSGTNFDTTLANDRVIVNATVASPTSATATSIGVPVPEGATSGRISVSTMNGTAVSATDLIIPPSSEPIDFTGRIGFGDANAVTVPINGSQHIALLLFDGVAGRRASIKVSNVTFFGTVTLLTPFGVGLGSPGFVQQSLALDTKLLPVSGTYTIIVRSTGDPGTGTVRVTLYDVTDVSGTIAACGAPPSDCPVTVTTTTPGQNARYTFAGAVNQRVSLSIGSGIDGAVQILSPENAPLGPGANYSVPTSATSAAFFDAIALTEAGTYTVFVNPGDLSTGSLGLSLHNSSDITTSIVPGGAAVNVATSLIGQRVLASFTAAAGQRVSLDTTNVIFPAGLGCKGTMSLVDANNVTLRSDGCLLGGFNSYLDVTDPLAAGTYRVIFDPAGEYLGSATLTLHDVPADVTGTLTINDPTPLPVTISTAGQNASLGFTAGAQTVRIHVSGSPFTVNPCVTVKLMQGTTVLQTTSSCAADFFTGAYSLTAGSYTVLVDPGGSLTGSFTISLVSP
jgi:YD repeat-containing protein